MAAEETNKEAITPNRSGTFPFAVVETQPKKETTDKGSMSLAEQMLLVEGVFLASAYMASYDPKTYGEIVMIFCPIGASTPTSSNTSVALNLLAIEALGLYNVRIDQSRTSKHDIFKANLIGWHAVAAAIGMGAYFFDKDEKKQNFSLSYIPQSNGGIFMLSYPF